MQMLNQPDSRSEEIWQPVACWQSTTPDTSRCCAFALEHQVIFLKETDKKKKVMYLVLTPPCSFLLAFHTASNRQSQSCRQPVERVPHSRRLGT